MLMNKSTPAVRTVDVTSKSWPYIERLFGSNGACGGCWCMSWRVEKGERWEEIKGEEARKRFKALIGKQKTFGVLALDGDEPVGWCALDRRTSFAKLNRAPSLACEDADQVWSLPCFFVKPSYRKQGIARLLLSHALDLAKRLGASIVEGYPVKDTKDGKPLPAAFAWTGTRSLFEAAGFNVEGNHNGGKQRVRKYLDVL